LIDIQAQFRSLRDEIHDALDRVSNAGHADRQLEVLSLEREAAACCGCQYAVACSSGRESLFLSLVAQGIGPRDQVITSVSSSPDVAASIALCGARPVLADINPVTFNLEPDGLDWLLTERTRAIVPVHLFGQCAEMAPILSLAKQHGLLVIEDAGQTIAAEYEGHRAGSTGAMGAFYFSPTDALGTFGDTGAVVTNDSGLAANLRSLRDHGMREGSAHVVTGGNFKLDPMRAAILRIKLRHLDEWITARQRIAARYNRLFAEAGAALSLDEVECLSNRGCRRNEDCVLRKTPKLLLPHESPGKGSAALRSDGPPFAGHRHVYSKYMVRTGRQEKVVEALKKAEISCEVEEPVLERLDKEFAPLHDRRANFPASDCAHRTALALPMYAELTEEQQDRVVKAVVAGLRE
jgi:dTDP-4-amino-4,6-dideoxygalactose transaminase